MSNDTIQGLLVEAKRASERDDRARMVVIADEILKRDPASFDALFIAGVALLGSKQEGLALQLFNVAKEATTLPAALSAVWNNIGCCLQDYEPAQAYLAFLESLSHGEQPSVYANLCNVSSSIGRHAEALDWAAKSAETGGADASYNKSFALFSMGRWAEAWPEYAKSVGVREGTDRGYGLPRFKAGEDFNRCLVHGEQGIGDEILFMSMLPADFGGAIECHPRNETLFARSFPSARVYGTLGRPYLDWLGLEMAQGLAYELEMGGIGEFFAPAPFARAAYLTADKSRRLASEVWLDDPPARALKVGIAWTGGLWRTGRARRSIPFHEIIRLKALQNLGVQFVNLEYEDRREELKSAGLDWLNPSWATKKGTDTDDLAALVSALDLVIAPTTSLVDLCGALGVECWAMVDENPQWRYSDFAGQDSMWFYQSVRCFRQQVRDGGKWTRVVGEVMAALRERVSPPQTQESKEAQEAQEVAAE